MKEYFIWLGNGLIYLFALIGFLLVLGFFGVKYGWTNVRGIADSPLATSTSRMQERNAFSWAHGEEWQALESAITKDREPINRAAAVTGVPARLIVSCLVPEQLRLFTSEREIFKSFFGPLQVLGNQTQFSWGVMGFKPETASAVETHLINRESPFYPGEAYEHLLDFETADPDTERFARIADEKNHYYSYLYAALYIKQIMAQWGRAGFDISTRPDVIATLFNIGFGSSKPNAEPRAGGAPIEIGETVYSFGGLAYEFYYSSELTEYFPR